MNCEDEDYFNFCKKEDHFKHSIKMRTIHNKHYENKDKKVFKPNKLKLNWKRKNCLNFNQSRDFFTFLKLCLGYCLFVLNKKKVFFIILFHKYLENCRVWAIKMKLKRAKISRERVKARDQDESDGRSTNWGGWPGLLRRLSCSSWRSSNS